MKRAAIACFAACMCLEAVGCDPLGEPPHETEVSGSNHEHEQRDDKTGSHAGAELIELSAEALQHVDLATEKVKRRHVLEAMRLPAEVQPHPDQIAHITPLVASQVTEVKARPGDTVKKGDVLAVLKSVQLGEARADIAQAQAALAVAQDRLGRQQQLMDAGIGAQKSFVEAQGAVKEAQATLAAAVSRAQVYGGGSGSGATTAVRSPLAGTIVERHATAGEVAGPDRQLFVIANIETVWVVGRAYESDLPRVRSGGPARISIKSYPERNWTGQISYVSPTLDHKTRTAEVRVELENRDGVLKPGMFATIIPMQEDEAQVRPDTPLAIPNSAVQRDGARNLAYVAKGERKFEARELQLGKRGVDHIEVLSGLSEGESVVVKGTFILKSEAAKHELGGGHEH